MSLILPKSAKNKTICESCGKEFSCNANSGKCWCFEIDLDKEDLAKLHEKLKKCLCEDCLLSYRIRE